MSPLGPVWQLRGNSSTLETGLSNWNRQLARTSAKNSKAVTATRLLGNFERCRFNFDIDELLPNSGLLATVGSDLGLRFNNLTGIKGKENRSITNQVRFGVIPPNCPFANILDNNSAKSYKKEAHYWKDVWNITQNVKVCIGDPMIS